MTAQTEKALVMNQTVYFQSSTFGENTLVQAFFLALSTKRSQSLFSIHGNSISGKL